MNSTDLSGLRNNLVGILGQAEKACTELILDAVQAKSQSGIEMAGQVAVKVRELKDEVISSQPNNDRPSADRKAPTKSKAKRRSTIRKEYPRFHIEKGNLVKTGWSKKLRKEYTHRATKEAFDKVVDVLSLRAARDDGQFPAEDIVKAADDLQEPIPGYQVYMVLGFLQHLGVVSKDGRRGYSAPKSVKELALNAWKESKVKK